MPQYNSPSWTAKTRELCNNAALSSKLDHLNLPKKYAEEIQDLHHIYMPFFLLSNDKLTGANAAQRSERPVEWIVKQF